MRNIMLALVLGSSVLAAGCSTPVETVCNKMEECGELKEETVDQCVANANKEFDKYRETGKASCDKIVDALDAYIDCLSGLSCADYKKDSVSDTACKQAEADMQAAFVANAETCGVE